MLELRNEFVLQGANDEKGILSQPYLNDEKELTFKSCSFFAQPTFCFILNEKKKSIEVRSGNKELAISLAKNNTDVFSAMVEVKRKIITDLSHLGKRLQSGAESLMVFDLGNNEYFFTSETILDNAQYSSKYNIALLYYVNQSLKELGKSLQYKDFSDMQRGLGKAFIKADLRFLEKKKVGSELCYFITIKDLVELQ